MAIVLAPVWGCPQPLVMGGLPHDTHCFPWNFCNNNHNWDCKNWSFWTPVGLLDLLVFFSTNSRVAGRLSLGWLSRCLPSQRGPGCGWCSPGLVVPLAPLCCSPGELATATEVTSILYSPYHIVSLIAPKNLEVNVLYLRDWRVFNLGAWC